MIFEIGIMFVALIVIVAAAELFTNGIEWLGQRLGLSEGVVGSVLAAVGTALPETLIPIVAVLCFGSRQGDEVGIGAITGAPFMLSTLTLGICGTSAFFFARKGIRANQLNMNTKVLSRDLKFFIATYAIGLSTALFDTNQTIKYVMATLILLIYPLYLFQTFKDSGDVGEEPSDLYLHKLTKLGSNKLRLILPQVFLGLAGIVGGAYFFVDKIQDLADDLKTPALVLSLIVCPIATELPEKVNSVLWVRQGKDTLALGNITGALVFQSCIPVAFGVAFTPWDLDLGIVITGLVAIFSASCYCFLIGRNKLKFLHLSVGGIAYALAVGMLLFLDVHPGDNHVPGQHNSNTHSQETTQRSGGLEAATD